MSALGKIRDALTRKGLDSATKVLLQLAIIAVVYVSFLAVMLVIARFVL